MLLEIVVSPECQTCIEARSIAHEMHGRFPWLQVEVIELDGPRPAPPKVVATPTYLLDGKVISLGNPRRERLLQLVTAGHARAGRP